MHTRILMLLSAAFMMVLGLVLTFAPAEIIDRLGGQAQAVVVLLVQATGGLYLGFAMLNWMARVSLIGGIYGRPIALGNFLHFGIVSAALGKAVMGGDRSPLVVIATVAYLTFAVWFGYVLFGDPLSKRQTQTA